MTTPGAYLAGLAITAFVLFVIVRLFSRSLRAHCTRCGSKRTSLKGEWDGVEDWKCIECGNLFDRKY